MDIRRKREEAGETAGDLFNILYGSIKREKSGSRGNRRWLANPAKENKKKSKKVLTKAKMFDIIEV